MRIIKITLVMLIAVALLLSTACGKKEQKQPQVEEPIANQTAKSVQTEPVEQQEEVVIEEVTSKEKPLPKKDDVPVDKGPQIYKLQILSVRDIIMAEVQQDKMKRDGINTEISQFEKNGEIYHRLRLADLFTKWDAEQMGKKLKDKYWGITSYWVVKNQ